MPQPAQPGPGTLGCTGLLHAGGGVRLQAFSLFLPYARLGLEHGEHFRLEIFEGCNFTGQCMEFVDDCPFLQSRGWAKSCVNAIKVYGDGA